jgi:sec-independent protein translocase protein TatB
MFDIGWDELLLVALVALVVIRPKELPAVLRAVGAWVARARNLAGEFRSHVDDMIREAGVEDMKREFKETMAMPPEIKEVEHQLMTGDLPSTPPQTPPSSGRPSVAPPGTEVVGDKPAQ